tara:strand:+ start:617 stop:901 length:285 start_codon:yes stop_codon:yes gene_type:complete
MYNSSAVKKAMGKKRLAKVKDWDCYGSDPMTFDILMKENWWYDGDGTLIILEAYPEEETQAQVIQTLKDRIDEFEYMPCESFPHGVKSAFHFSA